MTIRDNKCLESYLGDSGIVVSSKTFGAYTVDVYEPAKVFPKIRMSVISEHGGNNVLCETSNDVWTFAKKISVDCDTHELLDFIRMTLPYNCSIIDDSVPKSILAEFMYKCEPPKVKNNALVLFVNDGGTTTLYRWEFSDFSTSNIALGRGHRPFIA